jgi:hypothetical protein
MKSGTYDFSVACISPHDRYHGITLGIGRKLASNTGERFTKKCAPNFEAH